MNKKTREKTHTWQNEEKKTKEQNINVFQSLLGGLPERERAWTAWVDHDENSSYKLLVTFYIGPWEKIMFDAYLTVH